MNAKCKQSMSISSAILLLVTGIVIGSTAVAKDTGSVNVDIFSSRLSAQPVALGGNLKSMTLTVATPMIK